MQLQTLNASILTAEPPRFSWRKFSIAAVVVSVLSLFKTEAKVIIPKTTQYQAFEFKKAGMIADVIDDQRIVTGKVMDENNEPLPGATIRIQGTHQGVITAADGSFSIKIPADKKVKLEILFIGFETKEIKIKRHDTQGKLNLKLKMSSQMLGGLAIVYSAKTPIV